MAERAGTGLCQARSTFVPLTPTASPGQRLGAVPVAGSPDGLEFLKPSVRYRNNTIGETAGMPIYDKPTRELMHEFAAQELKPGQAFSRKDAVRWFAERYPDIKGSTVGLHVDGMSVNSPQRRHHPGIRPDRGCSTNWWMTPRWTFRRE